MPVPVSIPPFTITAHTSPSAALRACSKALHSDIASERNSNIILPHLLKYRDDEQRGHSLPSGQCWITCTDSRNPHDLEFLLSCTEGPLGSYPIFIHSSKSSHILQDITYLEPRIRSLVTSLRSNISSPRRVFSVFAPEPVAQMFALLWSTATGTPPAHPSPFYYAALFSYCTISSFVDKQLTIMDGTTFDSRPAVPKDLAAVARLCKAFAATSEPFAETDEMALKEAELLIQSRKVWVHEIAQGDLEPQITSIVAFTRISGRVAAITKAYTDPAWRKRGCAERLVRRVTSYLLKTKEAVVLYVSHGNPAAHVYNKVGFVGLRGNWNDVEGVDRWLEVGFDSHMTDLGHW